jgi:hypothetical protein
MNKKIRVVGWIIEAELSDGRIVTLDIEDIAGDVDNVLARIEEEETLEDYIYQVRRGSK